MPAPLNSFKTITANVTITANTVYTAPPGYSAVLLLAQVSNVSENIVKVSARYTRGPEKTSIISNAMVPVGDAINLLTGKMILQTGDGFEIQGNVSNASQLILSVLETGI